MKGVVIKEDRDVFWESECVRASIGWNVAVWRDAVRFWFDTVGYDALLGRPVLEIGAGNRSSLCTLLAELGADPICTYYGGTQPLRTTALHQLIAGQTGVRGPEAFDLTAGPYREKVTAVCCKSVLGGIASHGDVARLETLIETCASMLRPGGYLLFCENTACGPIQALGRELIGGGKKRKWSYFPSETYRQILGRFGDVHCRSFGYMAFADFKVERINKTLYGLDQTLFEGPIRNGRGAISSFVMRLRDPDSARGGS